MPMAQRAKFAGSEAGVGIFVLGLFLVMGVLAWAGVLALLVTGEVAADGQLIAAFAVGTAALAWWAWSWVGDLRNVRVVEIGDDGTWVLKGPLGRRRGLIPPASPRTIEHKTRAVWIFGVPRKYTQSWLEIGTPDRVWRTCASIPEAQREAIETLRSWIRVHRAGGN